jgi:hypothetical protein
MSVLAATTIAAPSIVPAAAETTTCSFPDLAKRFVRIRERNNAQRERDKMGLDDHCHDENGVSIPWTEIHTELHAVERALLARTPHSIIDLAWQAEVVATSDVESEVFDSEPTEILAKLIEHIRVVAGPLPIPDAPTVLAVTNPADPTLAAIEAHRRAVAAYNAFCIQQDQLEEEIPREKRQTQYGADETDEVIETDDPRWIAFQRELERLYQDESEAECALADIVPTTLRGVISLLNYAAEVEKIRGTWADNLLDPEQPTERARSWYYFVHRNLAECLEKVA